MAKEDARHSPAETPTTTVSLSDFLLGATVPKEMARAFADQMRVDGVGHLTAEEWQRRLALFQTKPTGTSWATWLANNGG
jgi:LmbE family N-acetylglucosaminyl deacetylase